ncbi:fatty acid desaturase [Ideonella sp. DXS22W]|uniref:Fatty acid desaturase n=1 Tax=Pseudaquabacterium inlustre TaxID=2984192 RepID=A0ABU9CLK8_9BURK
MNPMPTLDAAPAGGAGGGGVSDAEFRALITAPRVAWPTVALFFACLGGLASVSALVLAHHLPLWAGTLVNGVIVYFFFSVAHDSAHGAISTIRPLNEFLGRISLLFFGPIATLGLGRWIHLQHHRFTNVEGNDPDYFGHRMDVWMPLRWANFDYFYTSYFLRNAGVERVRKLLPGLVGQLSLVAAIIVAGFWFGYGWEVVALWLLPSRISSFLFVTMFVYLPHAPFSHTSEQDEYKATSIRGGCEWLLTPLMTYQNYHLVHHLYPGAPFYRMLRIWNARRAQHLARQPFYVGTFSASRAVPAPRV